MARLQHIVATGRYTLPVSVLIALLCWAGVFIYFPDLELEGNISYPILGYLQDMLPFWGERILSLICCFIIGFFLIQLNNHFAIIRRRASVQTSIFLLTVSACPLLHSFYVTDISIILIQFSIYYLFKCYMHPHPMGYIFNAFVFLGFAGLLFPQCLWFTPVFLFGIGMITTMKFKYFHAALLGCGLPYFFLWAYAYWKCDMGIFYQPFIEMVNFPPFNLDNVSITKWVIYAYFFVIYVVSSVFCFMNKYKDKIRARLCLRFIILFLLSVFIYIILQPAHSVSMLLLLLTGISILAAHFFVLSNSKASNLFFIGAIIGLILLFAFNIRMLL